MDPYNTPASQTVSSNTAPTVSHCGFGISAFILSIVSCISIFAVFGVAGYLTTTTPGGLAEDSGAAMVIGLFTILLVLLLLVALVLSIVSLFRADKKKVFGILALAISLLVIILVVGVIALGVAIG